MHTYGVEVIPVKKTTIYGLPLNPTPLLEQLKGASFCVSYGTRQKLGKQLEQAIELVGNDGILLVDNGAYSAWQKGVDTMSDESYLEGYAAWANDILARCPQAIAVFPDVIGGTPEQNWQLVLDNMMLFDDPDRVMPIWHLDEPIWYLLNICEGGFGYIGLGSAGEYGVTGTAKWHARMREVFAAVDKWATENKGMYTRPRFHMMRAQAHAHRYP